MKSRFYQSNKNPEAVLRNISQFLNIYSDDPASRRVHDGALFYELSKEGKPMLIFEQVLPTHNSARKFARKKFSIDIVDNKIKVTRKFNIIDKSCFIVCPLLFLFSILSFFSLIPGWFNESLISGILSGIVLSCMAIGFIILALIWDIHAWRTVSKILTEKFDCKQVK
ncbi:MAG: hypothetical protein FWD58_06820 [Firmicutes bacterium]|nr:hypothetical protein [Bacillota bacterium]